MKARRLWGWVAAVALSAGALAAAGCGEKSTWGTGENFPVVGVTASGVGFSVLAKNFTFVGVYIGPTTGDSIGVGLAVGAYEGGTAILLVNDSTGALLLSQAITSETAQGQTTLKGKPPYKISLEFQNFSGVFALGVGSKAN